ncbi:hypothetical protein L596_026394 [Steinernema carpocapsae]|uniref:Mon2/Sec7/BIG1-like dimerisation and cyclophilin-binding domain-containing protein n=1 Tax=Steinernema carpocapsae TaxID=34508 RepID=A0A4U5M1A0_STECR|nr:hypothetical protein L596_026394 [Steinernema carpocapsae]
MEKVLANIVAASGSKFSKVKDAANVAKEHIALPNPPICSHREKCLAAVELALDTGNPKLSALAVEALQLIVRDERFRSGDQTELTEQTLSIQLLNSLASLPAWNKGCQCHCLTVVVQLICSSEIKISLGAVQSALQASVVY